MQTYSRIFPFGTRGGDQVNSISVSESARASTFSGLSGTGFDVVCDVVLVLDVGFVGVVGDGVVTGRGSPVRESIDLIVTKYLLYWPTFRCMFGKTGLTRKKSTLILAMV